MHRIKWLKVLIITLLLILLPSCTAFPWLPPRSNPVIQRLSNSGDQASYGSGMNLGMVMDLSGPLADAAKDAVAGATLAIDEINDAGGISNNYTGIKNLPVRLIIKDSETTIEGAVSAAKSLISDNRVSAIIAPLVSQEVYAIARATKDQVLLLTYEANAQYLTVPNSYSTFQIGPSNYMEGKAQAIDLASKNYKKYFILGTDDDDSRLQAGTFKEWLTASKPEVEFVGEFWQSSGLRDYTVAINKALATQPQMVYSTLKGKELVAFTLQAKKIDFFGKVAFTAPYDAGVLQELKQDMIPGVRAYSRAPFFGFTKTTLVRRFLERYQRNRVYPSDTAILAYEAVRVWANLITTSKSPRLKDTLYRAEGMSFEFLTGNSYFRGYDHQSSMGSFIGETKWNDVYGFMTYDNLRYVSAEDLWRPIDEIKNIKARPPAVNLGILTDLTGELATTANETVKAVEVTTDQINSAGGLLGRHIELLKRDGEQSPEKAAKVAEDMILQGRANAIIGPVGNTTAIALTDVARKYGVPFIFHYANSERLTSKLFSERVFQVGPSTYMVGRLRAVDLAEQKYSRYWIIGPRYGTAQEESEAFKSWMTKLRPDVKFLGETWLPIGNEDYSSALSTILAAKPDMVYSNLVGGDLVSFTRQANRVKFFDLVAFTAPYDVGALQELKRDVVPGIRAFSRAPFFASTDPDMKAFVEKYRERTSIYPSDAAVLAYQSVMLWAKAVTGVESFSSLIQTLARDYESPFGLRTVRKVDHQTNSGIFVGYTEWSDEYGFMVYKDMKYLSPEAVWRSPVEAFAIRQAP